MIRHSLRAALLGLLLSLTLLALSGCAAAPAGPIDVTLTDYAFKLSRADARAGDVTFAIHNKGGVTHEMVVVQTDLAPDKLPQSADGVIDEEKLTSMGEQGDLETGKDATLTLNLHPGHYVLICNLPGHFKQGMYSELTVAP